MNATAVVKAFPEASRRREALSFKHHAEVAALPPADPAALLDWCEETIQETEKASSTRELRGEVSRRRIPAGWP
jgi:hypothetical protein